MTQLAALSLEDLQRLLDEVEGKKPTLRVVVGINYKQGVTPTELARWYDLSRTTVYNWLDRLERLSDESAETVLVDARRPGRPPKLSTAQRATLGQAVANPPLALGLEADEWTPALLRRYIEREFGVEFSLRHTRDLLSDLR